MPVHESFLLYRYGINIIVLFVALNASLAMHATFLNSSL